MTARHTRWAMVAIGIAFWLLAIAWPGMQVSILLLAGALVAWATFGLMTE